MKNIILGLTLLLLSGCAVVQPIVDRFTISPFDSNEYALVNTLRTLAIQAKPNCNTADDPWKIIYNYVEELHNTSLLLKNYSEYIPKNDQTIRVPNSGKTHVKFVLMKMSNIEVYLTEGEKT